jgi:hypothetical protein
VWAGNNDHRPMRAGADGVFVAAPLWRSIVDRLLLRSPAEPFLAYTKTASDPALKLADESPVAVIYYRISTGKKISAEKAARIGMDKVRIEKIFPEADSAGN